MRQEDQVTMQADIVVRVTDDHRLRLADPLDRLAEIRVPEDDDGADLGCGGGGEEGGRVVHELPALGVPGHDDGGGGAGGEGVGYHVCPGRGVSLGFGFWVWV